MNGSRTISLEKVYNWIKRYGRSAGNGAGCPTLRADSDGISQTDFVNSRNSSLDIVLTRPSILSRRKLPFEKTRIYSWVSRRVGFVADCQLPQAVEVLAEEALSQMISPRIKKPSSVISLAIKPFKGM